MASTSADAATSAVLQALQTLYHDPDSANKRRANEWLEEFQHSLTRQVEAWQTCHNLLTSPASPLEGRLFSAQTLRAKILYDLPQLPREQLPPLRDSLLASLTPLTASTAPTGSKAVVTQLCLALADLALQMPEWHDVVQGMIERFGKDPGTVAVLLGFLKALVEEVGNSRLTITDSMISAAAEPVIGVLNMYIQAPGLTPQIQSAVFDTLRSWLQGGEVMASQVAATPLFSALFDALPSDQLFDAAVDCLCDLIHETQELQDNLDVIQQVIPRIVALRPQLEEHTDDPDRIRGYCRILCEAGETYKDLIISHLNDLLPLVQAIAACAAYPDLDIVPITFNFWYHLAISLSRQATDASLQPLFDIYSHLQTVIIGHLHFPADDEPQTAAERDEFRMFRHRMGDTLKDCCVVLGAPTCLRRSYELVQAAMSNGTPSWQEVEAPLFSMRSMGAEVDPEDDEILPHIMDMLPTLPDHPRIRYAAILVLSRYTQWIDRHPGNLAFQLQYISAGFEMADEVSAAAAQAMKFMCQDCSQHLVPFLPQLHTFVTSVGDKLDQTDMIEVCEAIGYIIEGMPPDQAAPALQQFCEPLVQQVQAVASMESSAGKPELKKAADAMEQMDAYLTIVRQIHPLPEACYPTASAIYAILDNLLAHHAKVYYISERVGSVLRRGLYLFPPAALEPVIQPLLERMVRCFEETGYASYLWIIGKVVTKFGDATRGPGGEALAGLLGTAFESVTTALSKLLNAKMAIEIPDVMDDYVHLFMAYINSLPQTLHSPLLHLALSHTLATLTCPSTETIFICLDALALLSKRLQDQSTHSIIQAVFNQYGKAITGLLINGVVTDFPEDGVELVQGILGAVVLCAPGDVVEGWVGEAVAGVPGNVVPVGEKQAFLAAVHEQLSQPGSDRLKSGLNQLVRAARRARERGRQARQSMGGGR